MNFSTVIPERVRKALVTAAGVGTASAMARDILTKWADAQPHAN